MLVKLDVKLLIIVMMFTISFVIGYDVCFYDKLTALIKNYLELNSYGINFDTLISFPISLFFVIL